MIWLAFLKRVDQNAKKTYGELYDQEQKLFQPLPETRFQACTYDTLRVDKRSTVPHAKSRYSVPVQYATKHVVLRAFVDRIEVHFEDQIIATHERMEPGQWSLQLSHYIALLETKPGLLDSGKPFVKQAWTQSQQLFRNELEFRYKGDGSRMFIDILLLAKRYDWKDVCRAIDACCKHHAFNEKAVLLEIQGYCPSAASPILDVSSNPLLQQSETGIRSLDCYDSLIDSSPERHDDQGFIDPSVGEPVSSPFARNAIDDKIQESHSHSNGILSGIGIPPSLTETSLDALGISEHSQAMLIG